MKAMTMPAVCLTTRLAGKARYPRTPALDSELRPINNQGLNPVDVYFALGVVFDVGRHEITNDTDETCG